MTDTLITRRLDQPSAPRVGPAPYAGWHLLAFASELTDELCPLSVADRPLVAVRQGDLVRVFDATCPHRGANLGYGGTLQRECIICPFHGRRIRLGSTGSGQYRVAEHPCVQVGSLLFVRYQDGPDLGFETVLRQLAESYEFAAGFTLPVRIAAEMVTENAFDPDHFVPVHGLRRTIGMTLGRGPGGELTIEGSLEAPGATYWDEPGTAITVNRFFARAYSPTLVITELGPAGQSPFVITGAAPTGAGCVVRIGFALPSTVAGSARPEGYLASLIAGARRAFRQDVAVWEHLDPEHLPAYELRDAAVLAFRDFCSSFA